MTTTCDIPLPELRRFAWLHATVQGIPAEAVTRRLMGRLRDPDGEGPGSWTHEWSSLAMASEARGRDLHAVRYYAMARFPYPADPARAAAQRASVTAFDRWRSRTGGIERLDIRVGDRTFGCWAAGLSASRRLPLLVVMGGLFSTKEQWAPVLADAHRLKRAVVVTEMPGVGENGLVYGADSPRMLSRLLDRVDGVADTSRTCVVGLGFSGHLAMRSALDDRRIRGLATVGAPVRDFFGRSLADPGLPQIVTRTLAHLTGVAPAALPQLTGGWALAEHQLARMRIPVAYVAGHADPVVPRSEAGLLRRTVPDLRLVEHEVAQGSAGQVAETRLWLLSQALRMTGTGSAVRRIASIGARAVRRGRADGDGASGGPV